LLSPFLSLPSSSSTSTLTTVINIISSSLIY
jgi:hypothetical protein